MNETSKLSQTVWWIADEQQDFVLGPFESEDLAIQVRVYVEKVRGREDLWILRDRDKERGEERKARV